MDIKDELLKNRSILSLDDLDYYKSQLEIGSFESSYYEECYLLILEIKDEILQKNSDMASQRVTPVNFGKSVVMKPGDIDPKQGGKATTPDEQLVGYIIASRHRTTNKEEFTKLLKTNPNINEQFFEKHFSKFTQNELDWSLENFMFTEKFLEDHFSNLTSVIISSTQKFSEEFFIKHMAQLDATIALTKGINDWKDKTKRRKKLDTILKLKGIYL